MMQIRNLTIRHKKDFKIILEQFQFILNSGEKAVIIGEEGNGKSTLLKWIYDPKLVEEYADVQGENFYTGERLGYLPQELPKEDYEKSVYEFCCEENAFIECMPKELNQLVNQLQLAEGFLYSEQKMKTLSGGERIKVQLARILTAQPTILLLDEPSNDIDIPTLEWLEHFIIHSRQSVLFVSHDETLIEQTATVIIHLEQLRRKTVSRYTVSHSTYTEYQDKRNLAMQKQEQKAKNEQRQEKIKQEKFNRLQQQVEYNLNHISRQNPHGGKLLKKKMKAVKSLEKRYERDKQTMTQLPETEEAIFIKFKKELMIPVGKTVLDFYLKQLEIRDEKGQIIDILSENIELKIKGNEKVCIIGKNGVGKSTLIRQIAKELQKRTDIKTAYMPQNYEEQMKETETAVEFLSITGEKEELTKIRTYLGALKYTIEEMERPVSELSGGQKAKLFLLKLSFSEANVLILDEPTRNFSPLSNPVIRQVLMQYHGVIISVSHDRKYIREVCNTVYELSEKGLKKIEFDH